MPGIVETIDVDVQDFSAAEEPAQLGFKVPITRVRRTAARTSRVWAMGA